jgi:molybdopterin-biosynthesis enzyme MoeA-like protein
MLSIAAIIVGNEVLSAKVVDVNGPHAARRARELGIDLRRIVVVRDTVEEIADEVARCSASHDWVFTSGGVGPTHDDLTLLGIAQALGRPLVEDPALAALIRQKLGAGANAEALRMAAVPEGSVLWVVEGLSFPQVVCGNVLPLPGVPSLFRRRFDALALRFAGVPVQSARVVTRQSEPAIAAGLRQLQARYPGVEIGSYPQFDEQPWTVSVTLDARDGAALAACRAELLQLLDPAELVSG